MVQRTLSPLNHPKLLGNANPSLKSNTAPLSSMRLRKATIKRIRDSVKRSTISKTNIRVMFVIGLRRLTCASDLEQIILLELFEDTPFYLDELIRH